MPDYLYVLFQYPAPSFAYMFPMLHTILSSYEKWIKLDAEDMLFQCVQILSASTQLRSDDNDEVRI